MEEQKHYFVKKLMQAFVIRLAPQSSSAAANHASATTTVVAAAADKKKMGCCSLLPPPPAATALYISSYHHHSLLPIRNLATPFLSVNLRGLLLEVKRNNKASSSSSQRCRHHCCVYGNLSQGRDSLASFAFSSRMTWWWLWASLCDILKQINQMWKLQSSNPNSIDSGAPTN